MTDTIFSPLTVLAQRVGRFWWAPLVAGIAWIIIGFVVLRFDSSTVAVISIVFGILVLLAAAGEIFRATLSTGGWRVWHIIFAILLLIGSVVVFVNPTGTFVTLALVVGFYFVVAGTFDVVSSLASASVAPGWWLQLISGILQIVLGVLASTSWESSVVVLVTYVSISAIFRGVAEISAAFTVRSLAKS